MCHLNKEKERFDTYKYRNIVYTYGSKMWEAIVSNIFGSFGRTRYSYMRRQIFDMQDYILKRHKDLDATERCDTYLNWYK